MLIFSSPSGAGKTTLLRGLLEKEDNLVSSISVTTRLARKGEKNNVDYTFVTRENFLSMAEKGELLEHAEVFGNLYGTPAKDVEEHLSQGTDVLFDVDWQGKKQLKDKCPEDTVSIFIFPPDMNELHNRLRKRNLDHLDTVNLRMKKSADEICNGDDYDYVIVNDCFDRSLDVVRSILKAERHKRKRQRNYEGFVQRLIDQSSKF